MILSIRIKDLILVKSQITGLNQISNNSLYQKLVLILIEMYLLTTKEELQLHPLSSPVNNPSLPTQ